MLFQDCSDFYQLLLPVSGTESLPMVLKARFEGQDFPVSIYSKQSVKYLIELLASRTGVPAAHLKCKLIEETK